jgi:hypothetical protein
LLGTGSNGAGPRGPREEVIPGCRTRSGGPLEGHPVGMSPASCRRAGALMAAPDTPG